MKCKLKEGLGRKLVAVLGNGGIILYLRGVDGQSESVAVTSGYISLIKDPLEKLLKDGGRTPVYKGDTIEITF